MALDGPDFDYASDVVGLTAIRALFMKPLQKGEAIGQCDIATAFLQSDMFPPDAPPRYLCLPDPVTGTNRYFRQLGVVYGSASSSKRWQDTLNGWLVKPGLIDELIQDYQFVQRLGMKHLKDFVYERWLQRWREPYTSECDGECREHLEEEALVEYFTRTWGGKLWSRAETPHGLAADNNIPERTNEDGKFFSGTSPLNTLSKQRGLGNICA